MKFLLEFHFVQLALNLERIIIRVYYAHVRICTRICSCERRGGRDRKVDRNEIEREGREIPWDRNFSRTLLSLEITRANLIQSKRGRMFLHECAPVALYAFAYDASQSIA